MALIDALPLFMPKPFDVAGWTTKLLPKATTTQTPSTPTTEAEATTTTAPATQPAPASPTVATTAPAATTTTTPVSPLAPPPNQSAAQRVLNLPSTYSNYSGLIAAAGSSGITDPKAQAALIGHFALEKGWGKTPSSFNYGNIIAGKSWTGRIEQRQDKDKYGRPIVQNFRVYDSEADFVKDYLKLLKDRYPQSYAELVSGNFNPDKFTKGLVSGSYQYAEDPEYTSKLLSTISRATRDTTANV